MNRVAVKIKEERLKAKMTEKQLAKKCGVAENYIIQVETGRKVINEIAAEKILNILGAKIELVNEPELREENPVKLKEKTKKKESYYSIEPTEQWADALANIIKKFPIHDMNSNKVVGHKELPILGKKVQGYHWEKILFVQASNSDMRALRIKKNDVIMVSLTPEIYNDSIYLFEMDQKKMVRRIRKEQNNKVILTTGMKGEEAIITEMKKIKIIGKCVKVEFDL